MTCIQLVKSLTSPVTKMVTFGTLA